MVYFSQVHVDMTDQTKVVLSTKVPLWVRREIGVMAAKRDESISQCVYNLIKLAMRREDWLRREVNRRTGPQLEFPPILVETREN